MILPQVHLRNVFDQRQLLLLQLYPPARLSITSISSSDFLHSRISFERDRLSIKLPLLLVSDKSVTPSLTVCEPSTQQVAWLRIVQSFGLLPSNRALPCLLHQWLLLFQLAAVPKALRSFPQFERVGASTHHSTTHTFLTRKVHMYL